MTCFKARQRSRTIDTFFDIQIDIEHPHTDGFASRNADQGVRKLTPPCVDLEGVSRRIFQAMRGEWAFAAFER